MTRTKREIGHTTGSVNSNGFGADKKALENLIKAARKQTTQEDVPPAGPIYDSLVKQTGLLNELSAVVKLLCVKLGPITTVEASTESNDNNVDITNGNSQVSLKINESNTQIVQLIYGINNLIRSIEL